MDTFSTLLLAANLVAFLLMGVKGGAPERWAVALVLLSFLLTPLVQGVVVGSWRVGVAGVNLALFLALWTLAERWGRWWLIAVAGFQLIILLTHFLPLMTVTHLVNTGVLARKIFWVGISIFFFFAAWEGWAARRYRLEGRLSQ